MRDKKYTNWSWMIKCGADNCSKADSCMRYSREARDEDDCLSDFSVMDMDGYPIMPCRFYIPDPDKDPYDDLGVTLLQS